MENIGIFICYCEFEIASSLDIEEILNVSRKMEGVKFAGSYKDLFGSSNQRVIAESIKKEGLDGVVVASCSPCIHRQIVEDMLEKAELDKRSCEIVSIKAESGNGKEVSDFTQGAIEKLKEAVTKLREKELNPISTIPMVKKALVIGGGVSGIHAALDIANGGYEVFLVERTPSIGGNMVTLSEVFPTLDCPQCILTPKMVQCGQHPNINILAYSEIEEVKGQIGDFEVLVKRKGTCIDWDKCTGCGECSNVCPVDMYSDFQRGTAPRKAIYKPFAQAVPNKFVIDKQGIPPCRDACPIHLNAQGYVQLISESRFKEALTLIRETLPFPGIIGRICVHPCETHCKREEVDQPISICYLKRAAADLGEEGEKSELAIGDEKDKKVAVIGAGPAGLLAAYDLRIKGYQVTIFDTFPKAGGTLLVGIPEYRLPRDVLEKETDIVSKLGVKFQLNTTVGKDISFDQLRKDYDALFIAIGAHISTKLNIDGEELKGVVHGIDFLRAINLGKDVTVGKKVAVVGGGNAAIDAARTLKRVGAEEVHLIYRRSRKEMPANEAEIEEAEHEGIKLHLLCNPVRLVGDGGRITHMECVRMKLGELDKSGRRRPIPVEGSEFMMEVDMVIPAIGQSPNVEFVGEKVGLKRARNGTLNVDHITLETGIAGVFAGGDAVTGPASAVEALAAGRKAAISIDRYLSDKDLRSDREDEWVKPKELTVATKGVEKKARLKMPTLTRADREKNFNEVDQGFSQEEAIYEAKRCLSCAGCCECMSCVPACEANAIDHNLGGDRYETIHVGAIVVASGYELLSKDLIEEYENDPDVMDPLQFERILCPSGPTDGVVVRPSDGKTPKDVVFIECVGSRDPEHHLPYCSRVCCMYSCKMGMLYKHVVHDGTVYVFYMDVRTDGKMYEEFYQRGTEEDGIVYIRGRVSKVFRDGEKIMVWGSDTLTGKQVEIAADLVILAMAMIPRPDAKHLAKILGIETDEFGFMKVAHPRLRPFESEVPGIFLAGCCQSPKDIPECVAQSCGCAGKVLSLFSQDEVEYSLPVGDIVNV
jgi:heterodisulfide reductase subunit A